MSKAHTFSAFSGAARAATVLGALSFALAWTTGCSDGFGGLLISDAQEVELGITVDQQIRQQYKIALPDDPISEWAVQLVTPLE
ncbi:MAG: hypothetical protein ACI9MR_000138, partial [Myxococcota bacterium]